MVYFTSFTDCSGDIDEKSSENELYRAFFFFRLPDPKSEKKIIVNQLIKKVWPKFF